MQVPSPLGPSFPAAKRQRFANEGGGDDDKDGSGKDSPPRLVFVEPSQAKAVEGEGRQEEQEQQLQLAFHQLGVRQVTSSAAAQRCSSFKRDRYILFERKELFVPRAEQSYLILLLDLVSFNDVQGTDVCVADVTLKWFSDPSAR